MGSRTTAAVSASTAAARASTSANGTCTTPPGSGANGSRMAGLSVHANDPILPPWKSTIAAANLERRGPAGHLEGVLERLGPRVGEEDPAAVGAADLEQPLGEGNLQRGGEEVRHLTQRPQLFRHGCAQPRGAMPHHAERKTAR